ncbi:signal peptidase I [Patescibacteria group bacterium]|nr:signal peptidase I [Patescibacteria group bacterium]
MENKFKLLLKNIFEFLKTLVFSLLLVVFIRYFIISPFSVKGKSMEPSFYEGEYLIVDEISYRFKEPKRGDVVVLKYTDKGTSEFLIKRIVALPGEEIIINNGKVLIKNEENPDGFYLEEDYISENIETFGNIKESVLEDNYFILGDNRPNSLDSRYFGPISKDQIIGRVFLRGYPFDRFTLFN